MPGQTGYYNQFGVLNRESILACPEPEYWTTDYAVKGRVYREMKERIEQQQALIIAHFNKEEAILDIGCGFGRQAILLARHGYRITGTDTSEVFIELAKTLFQQQGFRGNFVCTDIISDAAISWHYKQLLLLDVLEHIKPFRRRQLFAKLYKLAKPGALLIVSLPHVKKRITSQLNNQVRRSITQHLSYFLRKEEHPYPIPEKNKIIRLYKRNCKINSPNRLKVYLNK